MLQKLFKPESVAVIGASSKELSIGNRIIKNLIDFNYKGAIYPINPKADEIRGIPAYNNVIDVPGKIDLAHIVIPNKFVSMAIEDCAKKDIPYIIVNTAGFKEIGGEGIKLEKQMVETAKKHGIRIFGPNCQGIINTDPSVKAYCNFTFTKPVEGYISIFAQSGGVGEVINQRFSELGTGVRMYASNGNACDISITEIIKYWTEDINTRVIILYIESISSPKELYNVVKEAVSKKPVLAMKGGRTREGAAAAASHTGGLAHREIATELLLKKAGAILFNDEEELCQSAIAFATQPIPEGNRVGLITNTGGPAIIATDQLVESGFTIPSISEDARNKLKEKLYPAASTNNPIDVLATASAEHFRAALDVMLNEENIDSIFINFVTPFFVENESIAREIVEVNSLKKKPVICNLMTDKNVWKETVQILKEGGVPIYNFPEMGARALSALYNYKKVLSEKTVPDIELEDIQIDDAKKILEHAKNNGREMLSSDEVNNLLSTYGIPVADWRLVDTTEEAVKAASEIGFPVVVKIENEKISHKSDVGGVAVNLKNENEVETAINKMKENIISETQSRFFIQKFQPKGMELIVGAKKEGQLGHVILFGLGGIYVEILKDVAFEITPVSLGNAKKMISSIKTAPILSGYRGQPGINKDKVSELIVRCSKMVCDFPQILEMDLNPVIAYEDDISIVDARIRI